MDNTSFQLFMVRVAEEMKYLDDTADSERAKMAPDTTQYGSTKLQQQKDQDDADYRE